MISRTSYEVIIAGAGPAGSMLAIELAKKGISVLTLEKARFPRTKVCAGGVTIRAASLLPFDIQEVAENTILGARLSYKFKEKKARVYEKPLAYTVKRERFDHAFVLTAEKAGAVVREAAVIEHIDINKEMVKVWTADGEYSSAVLVGADGAGSRVRSLLGLSGGFESGLGVDVLTPKPPHSRWEDLIQLDYGLVNGGYGWIFPQGDILSVGAGGPLVSAKAMKPYVAAFMRSCGLEADGFRLRGHLMPVRKKGAPLIGVRSLLVGDAAGMIDPLTGEGIYYALKSALISVNAVVRFLKGESADLSEYQNDIARELVPELEVARSVQKINTVNPRLFFELLKENDRCWNAFCRLLRGEKTYVQMKSALGPLQFAFSWM
jgi:geranylgeranyl reductase family protein